MKRLVAAFVLPLVLLSMPLAHAGGPPSFGRETVLPGSGGAEPSLVVDTSGTSPRTNAIYVSAISPGPNLWHSFDDGVTWSQAVGFDGSGTNPGGDADVAVGPNGTVYVVDLNVTHNVVQTSTDGGVTFSPGVVTAPESDRPWITAAPDDKTVYVAYHDFAAELPVVCTSTDNAATFPLCGDADQGTAQLPCTENTDVSKKLQVDPVDKSINFMFECSSAQENASQPPYGPVHDFYLAQSTNGGVTYTVYPVYQADTSNGKAPNLAAFWTSFVIDSAGNYYALLNGTMDDAHPMENPFHVWLVRSTDHGHTWSAPVQVDHEADGKGAHVLSDLMATAPGQVDVVFYGTTTTGEPNGVCGDFAAQAACPENSGFAQAGQPGAPQWRVSMAQSVNALSANPTFTQTPVTTEPTHFGEICTNGLVCSKSDRSLLDYISVGVDCQGLAHVAFGGNPDEASGQAPQVYEVDQTGGSTLAAPASCPPSGGVLPESPSTAALPLVGGFAAAGLLAVLARRRRSARSA